MKVILNGIAALNAFLDNAARNQASGLRWDEALDKAAKQPVHREPRNLTPDEEAELSAIIGKYADAAQRDHA